MARSHQIIGGGNEIDEIQAVHAADTERIPGQEGGANWISNPAQGWVHAWGRIRLLV